MEIKTKFGIGDTLFTIEKMRITSFKVGAVGAIASEDQVRVTYYDGLTPHSEADCFPTKEALMDYINGK